MKNKSISKFSEDFLKKSLIIEEKDRVTWEKLFEMLNITQDS